MPSLGLCYSLVSYDFSPQAQLVLTHTLAGADSPRVSDFSSKLALRLWHTEEASKALAYRKSYIYQPERQDVGIPDKLIFARKPLVFEDASPDVYGLLKPQGREHPVTQAVKMQGSLYLYRKLESRALLAAAEARGTRRRHIARLFQNFLMRRGSYTTLGGVTLVSALSRVFFFYRLDTLRSLVRSGHVQVNFRRCAELNTRLSHGDFVSVSGLSITPSLARLRESEPSSSSKSLQPKLAAMLGSLAAGRLAKAKYRGSRHLVYQAQVVTQDFELDLVSSSFFFLPDSGFTNVWLPFNPYLWRLLELK